MENKKINRDDQKKKAGFIKINVPMKIIYSGGINKYDPEGYRKSYFYKYSKILREQIKNGKKICFVTLAKPDHYYDEHIIPQFGKDINIIGHSKKRRTDWNKYDLIFICGGDTPLLKKGLISKGFSLEKLKKESIILGDSAGAMVLASYFYDSPDNLNLTFHKGLFPKANFVVCVHTNNPRYFNKGMLKKIEKFAKTKGLKVLMLKEYEEKLYEVSTPRKPGSWKGKVKISKDFDKLPKEIEVAFGIE